jgi:hypothetical protein
MDAIWYGFRLAIGLFSGFVAVFLFARWLRFRWYLTVWADANQMPLDVRKAILYRALRKYRRDRSRMSQEERQRAAEVLLGAFGSDSPIDDETRTELLNEAVRMISDK